MAQGKFGGGTGLITDPYLIEDIADLNQIRVNPHLHYKMKYSVNAGVAPYNEGNGWNPIENFTGTFDGNGKKIFNLFINRPNEDNVGLFRVLYITNNGGYKPIELPDLTNRLTNIIYDLGLENVNIVGRNAVGSLIGMLSFRGYGASSGNTITLNYPIKRVFTTGTVKGSNGVGGLMGRLHVRLAGSVSGWSTYTSYLSNFIQDIYTNCSITASNANTNYAGIVGRLTQTNDSNNWNSAGNNMVTYVNNLGRNIVTNSTFVSTINGLVTHPIIATNDSVPVLAITEGYYNTERWGPGDNPQATSVTTEQMKRSTYLGAIVEQVNDFDLSQRTWTFERGRYPQLYFAIANNLFIQTTDGFYSLDGSGKLVKLFEMMPTREEAMQYGFKNISKITTDMWNELRSKYDYVDLVNIVERSSNVANRMTVHELDSDESNSSEDKLVYRKTFSFADFNDGIATIRTV